MEYNTQEIEKRWKKFWEEKQIYKVENKSDKPKYYVLDMFPYPSGSGLHVGHPLGYIASDIYSRYKRLNGFNVLHPMGYDAFGLPAEQYAIDTGVHPAVSTEKNVNVYRAQLDNLGCSYDWSREVKTCEPSYYKWTQWIFLKLYSHFYDNDADKAMPIADLVKRFEADGNTKVNAANNQEGIFSAKDWTDLSELQKEEVLMNYRIAYRKNSYVNWCEALGTVLANDEVKDGLSERGGFPVEKRPMLQWSLRTTAYAQRLLDGLETVDWSDALKAQQRNWIGRSEGAQVFFEIQDHEEKIEIFTTRPDTIFGATFMVLAPEHDLVTQITSDSHKAEVEKYLKYVKSRSDRERMTEVKKVTGVFTGAYALNPFTGDQVPIWLGEYVLKDYGTGAIMAVPSDDERDQAFAENFGLPIIDVIDKSAYPDASLHDKVGKMINSDFITGLEVKAAIEAVLIKLEEKKIGKRRINYKLRDAGYSRQRYWGEPIPINFDANGITKPLAEHDLPLELPSLTDFKPTADGKSPLAKVLSWVDLAGGYMRETDTMPGFAGSSWYFLRYMDADNPDEFASKEALDYWQNVDLYIGGSEHAVGHLLYSRVWHKFLYDLDLVPTDEPFKKLINQGMIQGVIEYVYLMKEKKNGFNHFICSKLIEEKDMDKVARIPVHVDFVKAYGTANSHLDISSIKKFIDWRPEYSEAYFECGKGVFHNGHFTPVNGENSELFTHSEVGKMSKRYHNVVNPDDMVERYGADCFRMYEMFLGPIEASKPWDTKGIDGVSKFLRKFWSLAFNEVGLNVSDEPATKEELKILHTCIKKVTDDIERFSFNTCVSAFMVCTNDLKKIKSNKREVVETLAILIAPFAPFIAEELWHNLGKEGSVQHAQFPKFDPAYLQEDTIDYPICINGKKRAIASFDSGAANDAMEKEALALEEVQKWLEGKTVRKVIVVPKRMINIVVS